MSGLSWSDDVTTVVRWLRANPGPQPLRTVARGAELTVGRTKMALRVASSAKSKRHRHVKVHGSGRDIAFEAIDD